MESIAVKFGGGGIFPSHQSAGSALVCIHFEGHIQEIAQVSTSCFVVVYGGIVLWNLSLLFIGQG